MNRSKAILASLRLTNSLLSTRLSSCRLLFTRVNHFSDLYSFTLLNQSNTSHFVNIAHQRLSFSTNSNSIVELILAYDWSDELENKLEELNPKMSHEIVIYVLKKLDKDPEKASAFFDWVCDKNGFRPSSSIYSMMLRILVNNESMKQFWIVLRKMKEQKCCIDEETYNTILGVLKKAKMDSDVVALYHFHDRMVQENAAVSVVKKVVDVLLGTDWCDKVKKELEGMKIELSDDFVIRVLRELRNYPLKALSFFNWVAEYTGSEHNAIMYNAILRVLAQRDSKEEFWSVVELMKNAGHEMDFDTYIKISRQFHKFKMMNDAVRLFEFMMDGPYKPSVQECSLLLRIISLGENPDLDLVFRVAKKYEATGNFLSKPVYDGIHRSLTRVGRFDEAEKIMKVMKNAGYEPDNITYGQLVFGLCKARRFEEASRVLDEMEENGCIPDIMTWTTLIKGHCIANEVDKALMCFAKMMEKNIDADADLLEVLINGFLHQKRVKGAYELLVGMVEKSHIRPWQSTFKFLIEKLLGVSKLEEAMNLLRLMKKQNYPPYPEPFVQYISKFGTVEDASEFLKALSVKEYPSSSAYLYVFQSFFNEGRHSEARDLLYKCPHHIRKNSKISELFGSAKSDTVAVHSGKQSNV
ncbi:pentatricopeptide repeat-containing protein At3g48250, chloroplastic [Mangifera indica]|uniref:pentatricopeptide repeat-containing protein At3g48250, chloroplastic n=1 Tax=Mangifera indica TaxID=29780 RepID=UPI001CFC4048|nr:pentatricopeptide repeat-containing protein At3g48250, chloroplastic [Mangifera indica]